MNLTFAQKSELDALVNFFGGSTLLVPIHRNSPTHRALVRKGLVRWGKRIHGGMLIEHLATPKGTAVARRFKKDWSALWADKHPQEPE